MGDYRELQIVYTWCPVTACEATGTNWNTGDSLRTSENTFYCEGERALAQVAQGDGGVSIQRDIQKLPGQPATGGPGWAGVGQDDLCTSTILWFLPHALQPLSALSLDGF